jgi:hypothetical protein
MIKHLDVIEELEAWLPSESEKFVNFIGRFLASLPGGEEFQAVWEPLIPYGLGWKEVELLTKLLLAIKEPSDTKEIIERLFYRA